MDLSNVRRMSKQQYETVREQLEEFGDRVTSRHGEDGAPARTGYRRFLGALDELAGRLLDDDEISQRGQDLLRDKEADGTAAPDEANEAAASGDSAWATAEAEADAADADAADKAKGPDVTDATEEAAGTSGVAGAGAGGAEAGVAGVAEGTSAGAGAAETADAAETAVVRGKTAPPRAAGTGAADPGAAGTSVASDAAETAVVTGKTAPAQTGPIQPGPAEVPVGESWAAANAQVAEENAAGDGPAAAGDGAEAGNAPTVDVVFSLPAEVQADRVALCGEFNDWSVDSTTLAHQGDGTWSVTVPLAPGTYRYKYLLDGETWENGSNANRYEENAYGTLDSVIDVS